MKQSIRVLIVFSLVICLIAGQATISFGESKSAVSPIKEDLKQIDQLTNEPETSAYDGYTVKINKTITKSMKNDIDDADNAELVTENYVSVETPEEALEFAEPEDIEYIEPNYYFYLDEIGDQGNFPEDRPPNDPDYAEWISASAISGSGIESGDSDYLTISAINQWNLEVINAEAAWKSKLNGEGVTVGLVDSGLYTHLNDFDYSRVIPGINLSGSGDINDTSDYSGHGSKVASVFFSQIDNNIRNAGITDHVKIMPVKVVSTSNNKVAAENILKGLTYAVDAGVDVINISMGSYYDYQPVEDIVHRFANDGGILVAPAGNNNLSTYRYPASYSSTICAGGVESSDNELGYTRWYDDESNGSNFNDKIDVVAPAKQVPTTCYANGTGGDILPEGKKIDGTGCSYAVPHVVAMAVIAKQFSGNKINVMEFRSLLQETSYNPNYATENEATDGVGKDIYYGNGIIDFEKFINSMTPNNTNGSTPIVPYPIIYNLNGGIINGTYHKYYHGVVKATLPTNVTKTGHTFLGWYTKSSLTGTRQYTIPPNSNGTKTFYAKWAAKTPTLKFKVNGGKPIKTKSKKMTYGKKVGTLPTPKRSRYNFLGWYTKKKNVYTTTRICKAEKNVTVYAKWTKKKIIKYNANGGTVLVYGKAFTKGKKLGTLATPTRTGYTFKGWYTKKKGGTKITANKKLKKNKNYTFYAQWKRV